MSKKSKIFYLFFVIGLFTALYLLGSRIDHQIIRDVIKKTGVWGPLIYILLMLASFIFAPLSGTPVFFAGWLLFGRYFQIYNFVAAYIGMLLNFLIARRWGRRMVIKFVGADGMSNVDTFTKNYGTKTLFFLRLTQGHFQDFLSYAFGLTKIKFSHYALISFLAPIPWLIFWQFYVIKKIGSLSDLTVWFTALTVPLLIGSIFILAKINKSSSHPSSHPTGDTASHLRKTKTNITGILQQIYQNPKEGGERLK